MTGRQQKVFVGVCGRPSLFLPTATSRPPPNDNVIVRRSSLVSHAIAERLLTRDGSKGSINRPNGAAMAGVTDRPECRTHGFNWPVIGACDGSRRLGEPMEDRRDRARKKEQCFVLTLALASPVLVSARWLILNNTDDSWGPGPLSKKPGCLDRCRSPQSHREARYPWPSV
ncbi:hypothetical protein LX36DRAFT_166747 [Colletotrichum falcatum]|nr:hypothetical protein LX36DRAFT_166747 [Colletotrichum falcatum]